MQYLSVYLYIYVSIGNRTRSPFMLPSNWNSSMILWFYDIKVFDLHVLKENISSKWAFKEIG